jgi:hypothetical protein
MQPADLFTKLESGAKIKAAADGLPLAAMRFVPRREDDEWRTAMLESPYLPAKKHYFDSRKQTYPDFFSPWQHYIQAALAAKAEILSGRRPMPSAVPAKPAVAPAKRAPEPRPELPEEPEEPMLAHELQRILREEREAAIWNQRILREKQREADIRQGSDEGER